MRFMQQMNHEFTKNLLITLFSRRCYKFTITPFIVLLSSGRVMKTSCKWSVEFHWEQKVVNSSAHQICTFCLHSFYGWNPHLNITMFQSHLSLKERFESVLKSKDPALLCMKFTSLFFSACFFEQYKLFEYKK